MMGSFQLSASCNSVTWTRRLRQPVGLDGQQDSGDRHWSLISDPEWAASSTWGGRTRTSSIFEQDIQLDCVELDIKFLLTPVVSG